MFAAFGSGVYVMVQRKHKTYLGFRRKAEFYSTPRTSMILKHGSPLSKFFITCDLAIQSLLHEGLKVKKS